MVREGLTEMALKLSGIGEECSWWAEPRVQRPEGGNERRLVDLELEHVRGEIEYK